MRNNMKQQAQSTEKPYHVLKHELFSQLLGELGISKEFAEIDCVEEGKILPGGYEYESGMILTEDGKVYAFWLDWDPEKKAPDGSKGWYTLGENDGFFREVSPGSERYPKSDDESFQKAKKELGLA
jgi:hypothetical protein